MTSPNNILTSGLIITLGEGMSAALHDRKSGVKCAHPACWCQFYSSCSHFLVTSPLMASFLFSVMFCVLTPSEKCTWNSVANSKAGRGSCAAALTPSVKLVDESCHISLHTRHESVPAEGHTYPQEIHFSMKSSPFQEQEMNWLHFTVKLINSGHKVDFNLKNRSRSWERASGSE